MADAILKGPVYWTLLALVALAPLPFGANRPWAWSALSLAIGILLVAWAVSAFRGRTAISVPLQRLRFPLACFAVVVLWILFQAGPWAPDAWHHPIWREASAALETPLAGAISVDPARTLAALMRLLAYAGVFWLALQLARRPERATQMVRLVALAGFCYSLYGLIVEFADLDMILWYERWAYAGSLTSTFVNRNSFATYAGISLIAILALIANRIGHDSPGDPFSAASVRWLIESLMGRLGALVVMALAVSSALLMSHSRAGMVCTVIGVMVLAAGLALRRGGRPLPTLLAIAAIAVFGVAALALSGEVTLDRIAFTVHGTRVADERPAVYALIVRGIADNPWLGVGYGAFEPAFPLIRDSSVPGNLIYDKAHNSYLEFAFETGLPAFAVMMAALAWPVWRCARGVRSRRRNRLAPCVALAATALVATHALVDFSLQIPAVAVTYALLLGGGCAQSWSSDEDEAD